VGQDKDSKRRDDRGKRQGKGRALTRQERGQGIWARVTEGKKGGKEGERGKGQAKGRGRVQGSGRIGQRTGAGNWTGNRTGQKTGAWQVYAGQDNAQRVGRGRGPRK
jgi:hypothetical protein